MNKKIIKKILGIPVAGGLSLEGLIHYNRVRFGKHFYKSKISVNDIVNAMKELGLRKGAVIMIHCSWDEFYNYEGTPKDLINAILEVIGPEGTLCMPAMPIERKDKIFDVRRTRTKNGLMAEIFRTMPKVQRSINVRHSVCALGPLSDYLLSEHHLGETCWDEKSPYYKLTKVGGKVFTLGLGKYWEGTIIHCVEATLRREIIYYADMFNSQKTENKYIDYDGIQKVYYDYGMPTSGRHIRVISYLKNRHIIRKYLNGSYRSVSNLQVACFDANHVVSTLTGLARKGHDIYLLPLKFGYKFN